MPINRKKRRLQFGLRGLLILLAITGVLMAWLSTCIQRQATEAEAIATLKEGLNSSMQMTFGFDYQTDDAGNLTGTAEPNGPKWIRNLLGEHVFSRVNSVSADFCMLDSEDLELLSKFKQLKHLSIESSYQESLSRLTTLESFSFTEDFEEKQSYDLADLDGLTKLRKISVSAPLIKANARLLEQFTNLEELELSFCPTLASAKWLAKMPKLKSLSIESAPNLQSLDGIEQLTQLENLSIGSCFKIESLKPLANLKNLQRLQLRRAPNAKDFEVLGNLKKLEVLNLHGACLLEDASFLTRLTNLKQLTLSYSGIRDLEPLRKLSRLEKLWAGNCSQLHNVDGIAKLKNLQSVHFNNCDSLKDLSALQEAKSLPTISTTKCDQIVVPRQDIARSKIPGYLSWLRVSGPNAVKALESYPIAPPLHQVTISDCKMADNLTSLVKFKELRSLILKDCSIKKLETLESLSSLSTLTIESCTDLTSLSLSGMDSLQTLVVKDCNNLASIVGLQGLQTIRRIRVDRCDGLLNVEHIKDMPNLRELKLENCPSLVTLGKIKDMPVLRELNLAGSSNLLTLGEIEGTPKLHKIWISDSEAIKNTTFVDNSRLWDLTLDHFSNWDHISHLDKLNTIACADASGLKQIGDVANFYAMHLENAVDLESAENLGDAKQLNRLKITRADKLRSIPSLSHLNMTELGLTGKHIECDDFLSGFNSKQNWPSLTVGGNIANKFLRRKHDNLWLDRFKICDTDEFTQTAQIAFLHPRRLTIANCQRLTSIGPMADEMLRLDSLSLESCTNIEDLARLNDFYELSEITIAGEFRKTQMGEIRFPGIIESLIFDSCSQLEKLEEQFAQTFTIEHLQIRNCANLSKFRIPRHLIVHQITITNCPNIAAEDIDVLLRSSVELTQHER